VATARKPVTITTSIAQASASPRYARALRPRQTTKWVAKFTAPTNMKATITISTASESNAAMLASRVEKPPRLTVEKAWQMASNGLMPAAHSASPHATVAPA
jgi:hypothetical protein